MPKVDTLYSAICLHCRFGSEFGQQVLLSLQCICAFLFTIGYQTRVMSILSWFLYLSLTLRNTWLNFILDRYFHYLLFYSMFLPLDECFSVTRSKKKTNDMVLSLATIALKLQITWIYLDAGSGKYMDPLGGWTYNADPLPALDTYARHTVAARYLYALLQPEGLRIMTPTVVYVELFSAPLALVGLFCGWTNFVYIVAGAICSLHLGIALTLNNTILLSLIACAPWAAFLPLKAEEVPQTTTNKKASTAPFKKLISHLLILSIVAGSLWFETLSEECNQSMKHIWSTLLHNRWNVFVGAEEYVTWEIAPGRLADDSVVDVWGRTETVNWRMPGAGAPCTSTSRPGRWRSFPYLAELEGEEGEALWSYLCRQWDSENDVANNQGRKLLRYNFFMLQADVLPNMGFTATRKRLIKAYECDGTSINEMAPEQVEGRAVDSDAGAVDGQEL
jgi:hypothetical protein